MYAQILVGLTLCPSWAHNPSFCEFMGPLAMLFPEDFSLPPSIMVFLSSLLQCSLSLGSDGRCVIQ